jgi:hypothetical protein
MSHGGQSGLHVLMTLPTSFFFLMEMYTRKCFSTDVQDWDNLINCIPIAVTNIRGLPANTVMLGTPFDAVVKCNQTYTRMDNYFASFEAFAMTVHKEVFLDNQCGQQQEFCITIRLFPTRSMLGQVITIWFWILFPVGSGIGQTASCTNMVYEHNTHHMKPCWWRQRKSATSHTNSTITWLTGWKYFNVHNYFIFQLVLKCHNSTWVMNLHLSLPPSPTPSRWLNIPQPYFRGALSHTTIVAHMLNQIFFIMKSFKYHKNSSVPIHEGW